MTLHDEEKLLELLESHFQIEDVFFHDLPRYNIAPKQKLWTIIYEGTKFRVGQISWGMMVQTKNKTFFNINAKKESLETYYFFKTLYKNKRCLILMDGYYEWQDQGDYKQPFYIYDKNKVPMLVAGLYDKDQDGFHVTLMTQKPLDDIQHIHHRMPVMLSSSDAIKYLKDGTLDIDTHIELTYHEVTSKVNQTKVDDASLIESYDAFHHH
ncbi:MAG: SOS response-associated peptidase [Acholeplasmataceae bacterium]